MNKKTASSWTGVRLVVGITGGIAAYKIPLLVRELAKREAEVRVVMTGHAMHFVSSLTLEVLSGAPVGVEMFGTRADAPLSHIEWTREIDLMLIAPATANFVGKMATGIADDLLSTMVLTVQCPVVIAPAMNTRMLEHPAVARNLQILRERGVHVVEPEAGDLACGEEGIGRMAEGDAILNEVERLVIPAGCLSGKRILVTAGPTVEPIDPVRFISNRSSGKMGYALAAEARRMGGEVTLISGPTHLQSPRGVRLIAVQTGLEMQEEARRFFPDTDVLIMAAAVSDFRAESPSATKVKKRPGAARLSLVANPDILTELSGARKRQVLVGFAAETGNLRNEAARKLREKNLDLLVANDVSSRDAGFGADHNRVLILDRLGGEETTDLLPKREIARKILDRICGAFLR